MNSQDPQGQAREVLARRMFRVEEKLYISCGLHVLHPLTLLLNDWVLPDGNGTSTEALTCTFHRRFTSV